MKHILKLKDYEWRYEIGLLEHPLDENIFNYLDRSHYISYFYKHQCFIEEIINKCGQMFFFVKNKTKKICEIALKKMVVY